MEPWKAATGSIGEHTAVGGHQVVAVIVRSGSDAHNRLVQSQATGRSEEGCVRSETEDPTIGCRQPAAIAPRRGSDTNDRLVEHRRSARCSRTMGTVPVDGASGPGEVVAAPAGHGGDADDGLAHDAGLGTEERHAEAEDTAVTGRQPVTLRRGAVDGDRGQRSGGVPARPGTGAGLGCSTSKAHWPVAKPPTTLGGPMGVPVLDGGRVVPSTGGCPRSGWSGSHWRRGRPACCWRGGTAADLVAEATEPAGVEPGDPQVAADGVVLIVAVDRRLELGEDPDGVQFTPPPPPIAVASPPMVLRWTTTPSGSVATTLPLTVSEALSVGLFWSGIVDAGEVGCLAAEQQCAPTAHVDVSVHGEPGRTRTTDIVVGKGSHQGGTGVHGHVTGDYHLAVVDGTDARYGDRCVGPAQEAVPVKPEYQCR